MNNERTKIYYVEDELDLADIIIKYLQKEDYEVTHFKTGEEANAHVGDPVDLWVLDIMLPGKIQGFDLISAIKTVNNSVPVIFTSARDQDVDKVRGLESGGDDYVAKPFSPKELILRIKAILKRTLNKEELSFIQLGKYKVNLSQRMAYDIDMKDCGLTSKEFDFLHYFIQHKGEIVIREDIMEVLRGEDGTNSDPRTVDDFLRRIRRKMPDIRIETIYGKGYRLL